MEVKERPSDSLHHSTFVSIAPFNLYLRPMEYPIRIVTGLQSTKTNFISSSPDQEERQWAVREFKEHRKDVLVATDIASKGLDFVDIQHVINYDMPNDIENYGVCMSVCICVSVCTCTSIYVYLCVHVHLSTCICVHVHLSTCICVYIYLSVYVYVMMSTCICDSIHPLVYQSVYLSIYLSVYLFVCLHVCNDVHIYMYM